MKHGVLNNASWIVGCKIIQSIVSFVIGMLTARYLGPSNYGLISYAAAIVVFFQPIVKLGFDSTLVNELLNNPKDEGKILGTSILCSLMTAIISIFSILGIVLLINANETETIVVCMLYSLLLLFQACEMTMYWFQSQLKSKYSSVVTLIAYVCVALYKAYLLIAQKEVRWFAVAHVIEVAIIAALLLVLYRKVGGQKLSVSFSSGKKLIQKSKYYIWSGLMIVILHQTDRIMLKLMLGETETGYYSAALTCVGIPAFIFGAIIDSSRPSILQEQNRSNTVFQKKIVLLFSIITYLSLAQSIFMTAFPSLIISVIYGSAYIASAKVLPILVWYILFGYYGMVRDIWILAKGKQKILIRINMIGILINIIGNWLLIPCLGINGAAIATVVTQFITNFVLCGIVAETRPVWKLIIQSMNPQYLWQYGKSLLKKYGGGR